MSHYIADAAVWAHVMGSKTSWGGEDLSDHYAFEGYVDLKLINYNSIDNIFLYFQMYISY